MSNGDVPSPQEDIFREILERDRRIADSQFKQLLDRLDARSDFDRLIGQIDDSANAARANRLAKEAAEQALRNTARSQLMRRLSVALKFLGAGFEAIGFEIELIKALREKEDFESLQEEEALNEWIRQKLARKTKDKELRTIVVQRSTEGPGVPGEPPNGRPAKTVLRDPQARPPGQPASDPNAIIIPGPGRPDIPDIRPDIKRPKAPEVRRPGLGTLELPELATPGIKPAPSTFKFPRPTPGLFSAPAPAPRLRTRTVRFDPVLTTFETDLVRLPQPVPQVQTQTQPIRQETDRRRRQRKCYKGLYKERRDGSITKTRWARIDCDTGEEFGDKRRTRKKNQVQKPNQVQPHLATLQGFAIRPG